MRKLEQSDVVFIEKLRATLQTEIEGTSSSVNDADTTLDDSCFDEFQNDFVKNHCIKKIRIIDSQSIPKTEQVKEHTQYKIEVTTDELTFTVNRRFRQFYALYKKIKKLLPGSCHFPKKNYNPFVSSVSAAIIQDRIQKLDGFLKSILDCASTHRDPLLTLRLFSFIQLKQTYENKSMISNLFRKSTSETAQGSPAYNSFRGHSSERSFNSINSFTENSIEFFILLINEPLNPGMHLEKLEEFIKNRKFKASFEQIKAIFLGFDDYMGILKFGLTTGLQSNRIRALQILVDLVLPERNIMYEKYEKVFEKLSVEIWQVDNFTFFDNPLFKVLYFRLLSIYCDKVDKDDQRSQNLILKVLFKFHQNIMNDYFHWRKLNYKQNKVRRANSKSLPQPISPTHWVSHRPTTFELIQPQEDSILAYYYQPKNILIFKMTTLKSIQEIEQSAFKWTHFIDSFQLQEYTGHYKYIWRNKGKKWNIKMKVSKQHLTPHEVNINSSILPQDLPEQIKETVLSSSFLLTKKQSLFDYYPDYEEEIWFDKSQLVNQVVIVLKVSRDVDLFRGSIRPWANNFIEDALSAFS